MSEPEHIDDILTASAIDLDEAHCFLNALGGPSHVFQVLPEREGCRVRPHVLEGSLDQHKHALAQANRQGAGVFVTVNEAHGSRKKEDIVAVRALFVDLDGAPIEPVKEADHPPNMIVETSPGRYHAYWIVDDFPLEAFRQSQEMLIEKFNADPACKDLPRAMRVPGFFHNKSTPFFVHIIDIDEELAGYA